mgnify:CR=1 FL=1
MSIRKQLKKIKIIRITYYFLRDKFSSFKKQKNMRWFDKKSLYVMNYVQKILADIGYDDRFYFALGTALGVFRDNKLLSRDMDLDIVLFVNSQDEICQFREKVISKGLKWKLSFDVSSIGCVQDTFDYDGIRIDIHYAFLPDMPDAKLYALYSLSDGVNKVLYWKISTDKVKKTNFQNMLINLPDKTEQFLKYVYGDNWMIPDPNYIYWENPSAIKIDLKGDINYIDRD